MTYLGFAETVAVGDVVGTTHGGCVYTASAALLQLQLVEKVGEALVLAEVGQLDVNAGTQTSAQVAGAGQDVAEMLVPHELPTLLADVALNLEAINMVG